MDIKEYLTQYAALKMEARKNWERIKIAENETEMPAMRQSDGSQRQPGRGDRFENASIRYMEVKAELQPKIDANKAEMLQIEQAINRLEDPLQREVLRQRYLDGDGWKPVPWREVAWRLYHDDDEKELQRVMRVHREAIDALAAVMSAKEQEKSLP